MSYGQLWHKINAMVEDVCNETYETYEEHRNHVYMIYLTLRNECPDVKQIPKSLALVHLLLDVIYDWLDTYKPFTFENTTECEFS